MSDSDSDFELQHKADANLRQAIERHAAAYDIGGELLNEYAIIAHWQKMEADGHSFYTTMFHAPNTPNHIALGLFSIGVHLVVNGEPFNRDGTD